VALTTVTVHGELLNLDGLTPAVGTVTFRTLIELRDTVDNIVYPPADFVATLDLAGEFTIVLPATDNPDLIPASWVYQVYISTATWTQTIYVQIPFQVGTVELADLTPLDYDPCAPADLTPPEPFDLSLFVLRSGDTMTGDLTVNTDVFVGDDLSVADQLGVGGLSAFGADAAFNANVSVAATINAALGSRVEGSYNPGSLLLPMNFRGRRSTGGPPLALAWLVGDWVIDSTGIVYYCSVTGTPGTWIGVNAPSPYINLTPGANMSLAAKAAASRFDRGGDNIRLRGTLTATGAVLSGAVIANITPAHRPSVGVNTIIRTTAGPARFQVATTGDVTVDTAFALGENAWLDSVTYDQQP
jgi:hypothetical protein